ncbi:hypothetical protein RI129_004747 [Pyrocoelia pectoralis]|uniref:Transposase n=1 Tax=Pyrocoelia pectoralis TaxID=417401 RepID=A0AAN7ZQV5_9COLE
MKQSGVYEWFKKFKDGREDVQDDSRAGRPSSATADKNVDRVRTLLNSDRRLGVRLIAQELNLSKCFVHTIINDHLNMRKVCAKLAPKVLTEDEKERRRSICAELLERVQVEPDLLDSMITGDELWVFECDPETIRQSVK